MSVTKTRSFHIGDVLSVTTGRLVSLRHMDGIYDVLQFLLGTPIWTHQIPRASQDAIPFILEQHPNLSGVDASAVNAENWRGWLDAQIARFAEQIELTPIPSAEMLRRDPVAELTEQVGSDRVIVLGGDQ